ncbi:MAG: hypothetical protein EOO65_02310 [Methanosarcinales archaeon]|nr:MAG: hypothetical protein EOO65_02310 [Methanosarcinales archaeon]
MQPPSAPLEIPPTNVVPLGYLQANGVIYELDDAETQIGRADSNDIVCTPSNAASSARHRGKTVHPMSPGVRVGAVSSCRC